MDAPLLAVLRTAAWAAREGLSYRARSRAVESKLIELGLLERVGAAFVRITAAGVAALEART